MEDGHCVATVHAEANAIIQAAKNGVAIDGAEIYTTASPCWPCFKLIANAGLSRVYYGEFYRDERSIAVAKDAGIELDQSAPRSRPPWRRRAAARAAPTAPGGDAAPRCRRGGACPRPRHAGTSPGRQDPQALLEVLARGRGELEEAAAEAPVVLAAEAHDDRLGDDGPDAALDGDVEGDVEARADRAGAPCVRTKKPPRDRSRIVPVCCMPSRQKVIDHSTAERASSRGTTCRNRRIVGEERLGVERQRAASRPRRRAARPPRRPPARR